MKEEERKEEEEKRRRRGGRGGGRGAARSGADGARPLPQLTRRDVAAITWLVEQRAATLPQVTTLLGHLGGGPISSRRGAQVVARWESVGVAQRRFVWHREPAIVVPTSSGAKLGGAHRWREPSVGTLRHTIAVGDVRLRSCGSSKGRSWLTEQALRGLLPKGTHIPDGAIIYSDGLVDAVEIELTSHGRARVGEAIASLLASTVNGQSRFARVLYLCGPRTLAQVAGVRDELPEAAKGRVVVRAL